MLCLPGDVALQGVRPDQEAEGGGHRPHDLRYYRGGVHDRADHPSKLYVSDPLNTLTDVF